MEERPNNMPECKCGRFKTWVIREEYRIHEVTLMWVNVDDRVAGKYGRWNFAAGKNRTMIGRAVKMQCSSCEAEASSEDLARVLRLFRREHFGGVKDERG